MTDPVAPRDTDATQPVTVHPGQTLIVRFREKIMPTVYDDVDAVIANTQAWLTAEEARIEAKVPGVKVIFVAGDELAVYGPAAGMHDTREDNAG